MTDEQVEKIIKSNMMFQMNLAGIKADFEKSLNRPWVGLTDKEIDYLVETEDWFNDPSEFAKIIQNKLKVLNT